MLHILHPSGVNWFYESVARDIGDDLAAAGVANRLITPQQLLDRSPLTTGQTTDILIVNANECLESVAGQFRDAKTRADMAAQLWGSVSGFQRRILVSLDAIETPWFREQLAQVGQVITEVFDIGMAPQTPLECVYGRRYHWIPESFTRAARREVPVETGDRPIPWAVVGHVTLDRVQLIEALSRRLGSAGVAFLPQLRPFAAAGSRNLTREALQRLLSRTQYYVWVSHHQFPYHEGLRALHALECGAVPAKIDPLFAEEFAEIPWVYASLDKFITATERLGHGELFRRARDFLLARPTLGSHLAAALYGGVGKYRADRDGSEADSDAQAAENSGNDRSMVAGLSAA